MNSRTATVVPAPERVASPSPPRRHGEESHVDPDHPSEALLPTFGHDRIDVVLVPSMNTRASTGVATIVGGMMASVGLATALLVSSGGDGGAALAIGGVLVGTGVMVAAVMALTNRRIRLSLDARSLTILTTFRGRTLRSRKLALRDIRTAHAVDAVGAQSSPGRRGLRIALRDGEEMLLPAPTVPVAALEWYAGELRAIAANAVHDPVGEVAPAIEELMSEESRERLAAARRAAASASQRH